MGSGESQPEFRWVDRYELIDIDLNDKVLKLMSRAGEHEYIGKEVQCAAAQLQSMHLMLDRKVLQPSPNLMRLVRVAQRKQSLCTDLRTFYLVFQKPFQTLKEESLNRKFSQAAFSEEQIDTLLEGCLRALLYLKEVGQPHTAISASSIFLNQDRSVVVGDPWLLGGGCEPAFSLRGHSYPSPEKILFDNSLISTYDPHLSDLFTLGVVLLEALRLQHMDVLYQRGYRRISHSQLALQLANISHQRLHFALSLLLSPQSSRRAQAYKLVQPAADPRQKQTHREQQLFKANYIRGNLQISQVKTVGRPADEHHFSMDTLPDRHLSTKFIKHVNPMQETIKRSYTALGFVAMRKQEEILPEKQTKMSISSIHRHSSQDSEEISHISINTEPIEQRLRGFVNNREAELRAHRQDAQWNLP